MSCIIIYLGDGCTQMEMNNFFYLNEHLFLKQGGCLMDELRQNEYVSSTTLISVPNEPHLACVLLLDTSGSMCGEPINILNTAINQFKIEISMDTIAQRRIDIAIISFNDTVNIIQHFTPIFMMEPVILTAGGGTSMGLGIQKSIDLVKERNRFYHKMGTPCFKPWIFMITDGYPTDNIEDAILRIKNEENKGSVGKLKFFALGVGNYDKTTLFRLTSRVMELRDTNFTSIFNWLSASMVAISVSRPGDEASLTPLPENARKASPDKDISGW